MDEVRYMISDASRIVQVEAHVLRYWEEELDLNVGRTELGHRYYTEKNIHEFMNIKELKERGLQLKAIKVLLPELDKKEHKSLEDAYESYAVRGADEDDLSAGGQCIGPEGAVHEGVVPESAVHEGVVPRGAAPEYAEPEEEDEAFPEEDQDPGDESDESDAEQEAWGREEPEPALQKSDVTSLAELDAQTQKLWQFEHIAVNAFKQALKENNKALEADISDAIVREMDILMKLREEREEERYRRLDETIRAHQSPGPHKLTAAAKEKKSGGFRWFKRY